MSLISLGRMLTPRNVVLGVIATNIVCRPIITMSNKSLPMETRRYTAMREFCTELFGFINTLTLATAIEIIGARLINRKATRKMIERIKAADWKQLPVADQRLKAAILLSSAIGTALSTAVATPLLNNLVLNRLLEKITGKNQKPAAGASVSGDPRPMARTVRPMGNSAFSVFAQQPALNVRA